MLINLLYLIVPAIGLIVPYSLFSLLPNAIAAGLIYGSLVRERFNRKLFVSAVIVILYAVGYWLRWPDFRSVTAITIFCLSFVFSYRYLSTKKIFVTAVLSTLIIGLFATGLVEGQKIIAEVSHEPGVEYTTDMRAFLKTYYLMKKGENYYPAFVKGVSGAEGTGYELDIGGWRETFIFYFWKTLAPNGGYIYLLAVCCFSLNLLAAYTIARQFLPDKIALFSPFLLYPYFHFPLIDLTYMQVEWWAMSFFIWGLAFYFSTKKNYSGIFFALSLATRELFVFSIASFLVIKLTRKHFRSFFFVILPLLCFFVFYVIIYLPNLLPYKTVFLRIAGHSNWHMVNKALAYSSWSYYLGIFRPFLYIITTTTCLAIWRIIRGLSTNVVE